MLSSSSSGLSKRPATDDALDTKQRKRSERTKGSRVSTNNRQHEACKDDWLPRIACHHDSWRNLTTHDHRRVTTSPQALPQDDDDFNLTKRHDTVIGRVSTPQKLPRTSKSFTKQEEPSIKQEHISVKQEHISIKQEETFIKKEETKRADSGYQDFVNPDSQMIPQDSLHLRGKRRWSGIELQPEFSPISQEQLAAEVKGIYAGLVMVEAKCINIDAQKASQRNDELSTEQWQALVALHRTLLYEHHDFLMATQHPSANPALLGLATKYSMPARMWKHGIHAFLEVLRHRRPHSQEYMLAFIYLAYQMMSLLLETVPGFTDTWIECLGDLARYRMAIEEDREIHTVWGGVAGRWYVKAADRHPEVGRLYHHSGILERPSLRKFYLYGRALTSIFPFLNAKESLSTLCSPIVEDEHALRKGSKSADALVICFHARSFLAQRAELVGQACNAALTILEAQSEDSIGAFGVPLAVTNIAALLGFGASNNVYRQLFDTARNQDTLRATSSRSHSSALQSASTFTSLEKNDPQRPAEIVLDFCYHSFNGIIRRTPRRENLPSLLPYVHVMLVFIKSLHTLRSRLSSDDNATKHLNQILSPDRLDWSALANFLNHIAKIYPISSRTESSASGETFPIDGIPLLEDYMIRGLVWAQYYFAPEWFKNIEDDDGSRCLEDDSKRQHRTARVQYLGMILAAESNHLHYDRVTRQFSTVVSLDVDELESTTLSLSSMSPRSGGDVSIESDYVMVSGSSPKRSPSLYAQEAGSLKNRVSFTQQDKRQQTSASKMMMNRSRGVEARVDIVDPEEVDCF
ncbi:hypothetical protein Q7P35_010649 [Cladosporium inversicolor]